jgi:hypothetical protein
MKILKGMKSRYAEVKMLQVAIPGWHWIEVVYVLTGWVAVR